MTDRVKQDAYGFDNEESSAAYERARPSYPAEAIAYVVGRGGIGPDMRVLDLAAGTGKLTRLLAPTGADVVAVEPMARMREQLRQAVPTAEVLDGTAEALPLEDGSVDAVTVAQGFHWFDAASALAEIRRVLVPEGHLFLLWNARDRDRDWVRQYGELLMDRDMERPYDSYYDVDYPALIAEAGGFGPTEKWSHAWEQPFDEELLVARTVSVSVVAVLPPNERAALLDRVVDLARSHPDLAGRAWFGFPYVTHVFHTRSV
jgi:ubiquinone/menaquinone biosynthesis C-methylase UbiE